MKTILRTATTILSVLLLLAAFHLPAGAMMTKGVKPEEPVIPEALKGENIPPVPKTSTNPIHMLPPRPLNMDEKNEPKKMTPQEAEEGIEFHDD